MSRSLDLRTEVRRLTTSKPVHAAAGAGVLASSALRDLPTRLARWRADSALPALSGRATEYLTSVRARATGSYEKLVATGQKALDGRGARRGGGRA